MRGSGTTSAWCASGRPTPRSCRPISSSTRTIRCTPAPTPSSSSSRCTLSCLRLSRAVPSPGRSGRMKKKNNPVVPARQRGQAVVEYVYVLPILLILLLGTLQFVFIYEAKLTLNQAVFVGTRQGALNSGSMSAIQDGLEAGLAPLYVHDTTLWALKAGRQIAHEQLSTSGLALTTIVNPTSSALSGFQQTQADGNMGIPNDNLMYRDPGDLQDGMNVQDANLLKVRVTVCFEMIVPVVNRMIYT